MAEEQECLHCALMRALDDWGKDIGQMPVEDIIDDLGEVAGHVMACSGLPNDALAIGQILQLIVRSTLDSFRRYSEEAQKIQEEIGESSAGQTLQ